MAFQTTQPSTFTILDSSGNRRGELRMLADDLVSFYAITAAGVEQTATFSIDLDNGRIGLNGQTPAAQPAAITSLTNSTGVTADDTLDNIPAVSAAAGEATAADLTGTNANFVIIEDSIADLGGKVNEILVALRAQGIIAT